VWLRSSRPSPLKHVTLCSPTKTPKLEELKVESSYGTSFEVDDEISYTSYTRYE